MFFARPAALTVSSLHDFQTTVSSTFHREDRIMTKTVLILAGATLLRVCGRNQTPPPAPGMMTPGNMAAPMAAMAPTMVAEHGGYVGQLGDTIAEVATLPD